MAAYLQYTGMSNASTQAHPTSTPVNQQVKSKFIELFSGNPLIVHSPGRINLIGEHTDYNNGYVMPAAIDKGIQVAIGPAQGSQCTLYSNRYGDVYKFDLNADVPPVEAPAWVNYFLGIIHQLKARDFEVTPFNCVFDGDLPLGAGLSSSAAVECGFAFALNAMNNLSIPNTELIHMAQWAEHNYVGVKCGIMDQFASIMGRTNHAILLDCQSLEFEYIPLDLKSYTLVLCDTKVKHSLASSEYNTRRQECESGLSILKGKYPDIISLRDVSIEMLAACKDSLPGKIYDRCRYVVEENERVLAACKDLKAGRLESFGEKMFATHAGLSSLYEVSCPELDFLIDSAEGFDGLIGARMMGGGFGGCTLNIIDKDRVDDFLNQVRPAYLSAFNLDMEAYVVTTGRGTHVLENPFH